VALSYFSPSHVSTAFAQNTSHYKSGDLVPKEAVYQVELFRVLHGWLDGLEVVTISNEVDTRGDTKKSLDFLYTELSEPQRKYAIELAASTTDDDLNTHANRQ